MKKRLQTGLFVVVFWIILWFLLDLFLSRNGVLFASPIDTWKVFVQLGQTADFWRAILYTFSGLAGGYVMAVVIASFIGFYAYFHMPVRKILSPFLGFFGYVPMISFTVVALIWYKGDNLFIPVSLFLSIPVIYKHTLVAMDKRDKKVLEKLTKRKLSIRQNGIFVSTGINAGLYHWLSQRFVYVLEVRNYRTVFVKQGLVNRRISLYGKGRNGHGWYFCMDNCYCTSCEDI